MLNKQNDQGEAAKAASPAKEGEQVLQVTIGGKVRNIIMPSDEEDEAITAAALADPDARPYTDAEWATVKPVRGRGRPAGSGTKVATSIRLDGDLLLAFRNTGDGWQTRLNDALREWAKEHRMLEEAV